MIQGLIFAISDDVVDTDGNCPGFYERRFFSYYVLIDSRVLKKLMI